MSARARSADGTAAPAFRVPVLGVEIERRSDLLTLAALLLALITAGYQLYGFLRGADVVLFPPPQVLLVLHDYGESDRIVRVNARMAYVNRGQAGYTAALEWERVRFTIMDQTYEQRWQTFQSFDSNVRTLTEKTDYDAAHPMAIPGRSAESHETYFMPHPKACRAAATARCDKWDNLLHYKDFIQAVRYLDQLDFVFVAKIFGEDSMSVRCTVDLDDDFLLNLALQGWAAPVCWRPHSTATKRHRRARRTR